MNRIKQDGIWLSPEENKVFMAKRFLKEHGIDILKKEEKVEEAPEVEESISEEELEDEIIEEIEEELEEEIEEVVEAPKKKAGRPPKKK